GEMAFQEPPTRPEVPAPLGEAKEGVLTLGARSAVAEAKYPPAEGVHERVLRRPVRPPEEAVRDAERRDVIAAVDLSRGGLGLPLTGTCEVLHDGVVGQ